MQMVANTLGKPLSLGFLSAGNHPIPGNAILPKQNYAIGSFGSRILPSKAKSSGLNSLNKDWSEDTNSTPGHHKHNIKLLANPETAPLPLKISLNRDYIVNRFVTRGSDGAVYEGFKIKDGVVDESKPLIFKLYSGGLHNHIPRHSFESYENEVHALSILSRLEECDEDHLIVIMDKLPGETLKMKFLRLLENGPDNVSKEDEDLIMLLTDKYLMLSSDFINTYFLVHQDIRPDNVMVDGEGELHLIDFARTIPLSENERTANYQCFIDYSIALNGIGIDYPGNLQELSSALFD